MVDTHHCHVLPRAVIWPGWAPLLPSSTHTPLWLWLSWPINCDTLQLVFWGSRAGTMTVRNASGLAWECLHSAAFFLCIKWTLDQCWEMLHEGKIQWSTYIPFDGNFALKRLCFFAVLSLEKKNKCEGSLWGTWAWCPFSGPQTPDSEGTWIPLLHHTSSAVSAECSDMAATECVTRWGEAGRELAADTNETTKNYLSWIENTFRWLRVSAEMSFFFFSFPKHIPLLLQSFPATLPSPFHTAVNAFTDTFAQLHVATVL